jgi:cytochrome c oxidase subunit 4
MSAEHQTHHHILPLKVYLAVGSALLLLTFITVEVALHDFGAFNLVIALSIASIKALLVAFFFMHLWYDNKLFFVIFSACLLLLTVFIVLTMFDTMRRGDISAEVAMPINPRAEMYNNIATGGGHGTAAFADSTKAADSTAMAQPADTSGASPAVPSGH